jgi:hypothetical protein
MSVMTITEGERRLGFTSYRAAVWADHSSLPVCKRQRENEGVLKEGKRWGMVSPNDERV